MFRAAGQWRLRDVELRAYSIRLHYKFATTSTKHEVHCMPRDEISEQNKLRLTEMPTGGQKEH